MSSSIDERVVSMKFDNKQFESGAKTSMDTLDKLKNSLKLEGATKGLQDVDDASKKLSLKGIADGVDTIASKFSAMSVVAITVLSNIATKALAVGQQLVATLTIDPMKQGFQEYEQGLQSFQTILANTKSAGTTVDDVNAAMKQLNIYANQTVYSFGDMTKAIGLFTAQGVNLADSQTAIKGIFNIVSLTGGDADKANSAVYQLSQAIASGTVRAQDWISVVNAGIGGTDFQNQLKQTARTHGIAVDDMIKKEGSFKDSLQDGWLSSQVLLETLSQYTGDLSAEQIMSMGYTKEQADQIIELGATAVNSATKIKSFTQLLDTLKSNIVTGWATSFKTIIGDLDGASVLWTNVGNAIGDISQKSTDARNQMLSDWAAAGGRAAGIQAIANIFHALLDVLAPVKAAFRDIFPATTGEQLADTTKAIEKFTEKLIPSERTVDELKRTFEGFFSIFAIAKTVLFGVGGLIGEIFKQFDGGGKSILEVTAGWGDWLTKVGKAVTEGGALIPFFSKMNEIIDNVAGALKEFAHWVEQAFSKIDFSGMDTLTTGLEKVGDRLSPLATLLSVVKTAIGWVADALKALWGYLQPLRDGIKNFFGDLGDAVAKSINTMDFNGLLDLINTGLFGGLILLVKKFLDKTDEVKGDSFFTKIKDVLDGVTGTLKQMQQVLKATVLLEIAGALALLTLSIIGLSLIDSASLTKALGAITVMMIQLAAMFELVDKIGSTKGAIKMGVLAVSLGILAAALLLLAASVKVFSTMSWEELAKGFASITVVLGLVVGMAKLLDDNKAPMLRAGASLLVLSAGLLILSEAVKQFSKMSWGELAKGMASVGAALLIMVGFVKLLGDDKASLSGSASLLITAAALEVLAGVVKKFADMSWGSLLKGVTAMATTLGIVAIILTSMDASLPGAASLVIAAGSILIMAKALDEMGSMSWESIAKSVVLMTVSLALLAAAMYVMEAGLPGAAALIVMAAALAILAPVLVTLGNMTWGDILKGLVALAGALTVLGVASIALIPALIPMAALAVILVALGAGILLAGTGIFALSLGLTAIGVGGTAAAVGIQSIADVLLGLIPQAIASLATGIVEAAGILANSGPVFVDAMSTLIIAMATAINNTAPVVLQTMVNLTNNLLDTLKKNMPGFIQKGSDIIVSVLNGLAANMPQISQAGGNLIIAFINGVSAQSQRIIDAAAVAVINFVNGVADAIRAHTGEINAAGKNIASAIIDGMVAGLTGGISGVATAAKNVAQSALNSAKKLLGIASPSKEFTKVGAWSAEGVAIGFDKNTNMVVSSAENMAQSALDVVTKSLSNMGDVLTGNDISLTPTIRPVLDLTDIQKGSAVIDGLLTPTPISPVTSYAAASSIATDQRTIDALAGTDAVVDNSTTVNFTQNNTSPKAISAADTYRQTNNQLSVLKEGLPG